MKTLKNLFPIICLLGMVYSQAMGASYTLAGEIQREYQAFQGKMIPNVSKADQPCKAVQFLYYLQENALRDRRAAQKIALIIGTGAGVGGISDREATPTERALMVRGLNFAVNKNMNEQNFNLTSNSHKGLWARAHQKVVEHLINCSQRLKKMPLTAVPRNPNYKGHFPQAPVFHPYNPTTHRFLFPVATKLEMSLIRPLLPVDIQESIQSLQDNQIDLFFVAQEKVNGWGGTFDTLFRPHYWVSPNGTPWQANVFARFSKAPYGETLTQNGETTQEVHVHDEVSSPNNFSIDPILPQPPRSLAFWSLCQNPSTNRYALTLHWILEDYDPVELRSLIEYYPPKNFGDLANRIATNSPFSNLYHFAF